MGACTFQRTGKGKTAEEAFRSLVDQSRWESGHSYSGEIGMKDSFIMVTRVPQSAAQARKLLEYFIEGDGPQPQKGDRVRVETWTRGQKPKRLAFTGTVSWFNKKRNTVSVKPLGASRGRTVDRYDVELLDRRDPLWEQLQDKWGPAGCIPLKGFEVRLLRLGIFITTRRNQWDVRQHTQS